MNKPPYLINCSDCGAPFYSPFLPTPGLAYPFCSDCAFKHYDLSNILYFQDLKLFLKAKLGSKGNVTVNREGRQTYIVAYEAKGKKAQLVCTVEWEPKYDDILPRHPIKNPDDIRVPPFSDMTAEIRVKDEGLLRILNEFATKFKYDGISTKFK